MKRTIALLTATLMLSTVAHADKVDDMLSSRPTLVAAVALLLQLPPNCTVNHRSPEGEEIARFAVRYGVSPNDPSFLSEVKRQMKVLNDSTSDMGREAMEAVCGLGIIYSAKVRDANR